MQKVLFFFVFTIIVLLIGRNLSFLPRISFSSPQNTTNTIKKELQTFVEKKPGTFSLYYKNLKDNTSFGVNENQVYIGGSLNKVPIIATLYSLAKEGKANLDDTVVLQKKDIQDYGTGSLRYEKPGSSYTLKELSRLSLEKSDNTAAKLIATRIGTDIIQKHIDSWGLSQTHMANNKTSAKDIGILFEKIYNGEVTSPALTRELLDFLSDTDFEDRIPLFLPVGFLVRHKTADVVGGVHDAGVISSNDTVFTLAVLSSGIGDNELKTKQTIGEIAKKIVDFQEKEK